MVKYCRLNGKTVCKNVSVPRYLVEMGKAIDAQKEQIRGAIKNNR